jgi:hypothetical protein
MRHPIIARTLAGGALAAAAALPAPALAQEPAPAQAAAGRVTVQLDVTRFRATASGPVAVGEATAELRGLGGMPTKVTKKVTLSQVRRGNCLILRLVLEELDLTLLGLNVHLDEVRLRITGRRRGGILGRLFCSLAGARPRASQAEAVSALNKHLRRGGELRPLKITVPVQAVAAQEQRCPVLDLVLGPLDLDLLGLVVQLNRVHLTITAIRGGGILGDLFCGLGGPPVPVPVPPV